jgi:hypothetical protein
LLALFTRKGIGRIDSVAARVDWRWQAVGTLRRHQGHEENADHVEAKRLPGSGGARSNALAEKWIAAGELGGKLSRDPRLSPTSLADAGNVGKDGKVSAAAAGNGAISKPSLTLPHACGSGNVGDLGKVLAAAGGDGAISPDVTGDKPPVGEGELWQEDA